MDTFEHFGGVPTNVCLHGTTDRIVAEHFAEERPALRALPAGRFDAVLRVQRRLSHEGCVSCALDAPIHTYGCAG